MYYCYLFWLITIQEFDILLRITVEYNFNAEDEKHFFAIKYC